MTIILKLYEHTYARTKRAVIDLTLSSNPCGASPHVTAAIKNYAEKVQYYPDTAPLAEALAIHYGVEANNILVGSGANQIIEDILKVYALNRGIITSSATFPEPIACITTLGRVNEIGILPRGLFEPNEGSCKVEEA